MKTSTLSKLLFYQRLCRLLIGCLPLIGHAIVRAQPSADISPTPCRDTIESNAAPALSSSQLVEGSYKYIAKFNPTLKTGSVLAYRLEADGNFQTTPAWDAGESLQQWPPAERHIISNQITAPGKHQGISLRWERLNTTYKTALGSTGENESERRAKALLSYIRGDTRDEDSSGERFQAPSASNFAGTVVSATPWVQARPSARFFDAMQANSTPSYSMFSTANAQREKLLWVGANDGLLHAFNAESGKPVISYLPGALANRLTNLSKPATSISAGMNGNPFSGDIIALSATKSSWASYLFSSMGRGAKGLFALDVTDPTRLVESNAAAIFKWQFTPNDDADIGHVLADAGINRFSGQASPIVQLNNGKWAVLVPNGMHSVNGQAALFIIGVDGPDSSGVWRAGRDYYKLTPTGQSGDNAMMGVSWLDMDNNGTADYAFATDIKGNVWKFDLKSSDSAHWGSAFKKNGVSLAFYTAKTAANANLSNTTNTLPISTAPVFGFPKRGGLMVVFGTGQSIQANDGSSANVRHRMYGIYDRSDLTSAPTPNAKSATKAAAKPKANAETFTTPSGTTKLLERKLISTAAGVLYVSPSSAAALELGSQDGWYFDFPGHSEMLLSSPDARSENIAFTSASPAADQSQCDNPPIGRFYVLDPNTGMPSTASLGRFADSSGYLFNVIAMPSADQKIKLVSDRSEASKESEESEESEESDGSNTSAETDKSAKSTNKSDYGAKRKPEQTRKLCETHPEQCLSNSCAPNTFAYRVVGQHTDYKLCMRRYNARFGWREVPGMNTFEH